MLFDERPLDQAVGSILAHSHRTDRGRIRKGEILTKDLLDQLRGAGVSRVTVATLEPDDLHEDDAASQLAGLLAGAGISVAAAATGRVNLHADREGLLEYPPALIHRLNRVHESITVATLPPGVRVATGQMIATVKIIPYAVSMIHMNRAIDCLDDCLIVHAIQPHSVCLVQTRLPHVKSAVLDKTRQVTEHRCLERQATILDEFRADHDVKSLSAILRESLKAKPDWILIFGASATSDRKDIVPMAIEQAGGQVDYFGMPVDPGNLLLMARLDQCQLIGMPGCARSPKYNGLDMVFDRLACNLPVSGDWISTLGVGGLLQEIIDRPGPRSVSRLSGHRSPDKEAPDNSRASPVRLYSGKPVSASSSGLMQQGLRVSALVLAAGQSTRFGKTNKLLHLIDRKPLLQYLLDSIERSKLEHLVLVTGHEHRAVEDCINALRLSTEYEIIHNEAYATGMAGSLRRGVSALIDTDAIIVCLADMPAVSAEVINALYESFNREPDAGMYIPVYRGKRGNPVLLTRRLFDSVLAIHGDHGARVLARQFPDAVREIPVDCPGVLRDVDTKQDLPAPD